MVRTISQKKFQELQRAEANGQPGTDSAAELDPLTGRIVDKTRRAAEVMADDFRFCADTGPLAGLYVRVPPESNRGEVVLAIRDRAREMGREFVEADVQAAADRVWGAMGEPSSNSAHVADSADDGTACTACRAYDQVDRPRRVVVGAGGVSYRVCDWCDEHGRQANGTLLKPEDRAVRSHEVLVAPDGIVEAVRPAEMTPDRGPDVGTTVRNVGDVIAERAAALSGDGVTVSATAHGDWRSFNPGLRGQARCSDCDHEHTGRCLVDVDGIGPASVCGCEGQAASGPATSDEAANEEPRFSGGGASDDDESTVSKLIPSDGAFLNNPHKEAPGLSNLADELIERHGFLDRLKNCRIDYAWARKGSNSKGKRSIGKLQRVSGVWRRYCRFQFVVTLSADTARLAGFTDRQVEAALFHQLLHIDQDDKNNWIRVGHDFEGFGAEIREYGPWTEDLKIGGRAFKSAVQLGLDLEAAEGCDDDDPDDGDDDDVEAFDAEEDGDDTDELLEADTTDDAAAFDADRPADPDADFPDDGAELEALPTDDELDAAAAERGG